MDIDSLRRELEEHLKLNPHEQAPEGFRDRFEHWAEAYEAEEAEDAKAELAELLGRVPKEAEAAAKAGSAEAEEAGDASIEEAPPPPPASPAPAPRPRPGSQAEPVAPDGGVASDESAPAGEAGQGRWLIIGGIVLALAAAAYLAFR